MEQAFIGCHKDAEAPRNGKLRYQHYIGHARRIAGAEWTRSTGRRDHGFQRPEAMPEESVPPRAHRFVIRIEPGLQFLRRGS